MKVHFTIYKGKNRKFYWRSKCGRIIERSTDGYNRRGSCLRTLTRFLVRIQHGDFTLPEK